MFTGDALQCQKETIRLINESNNDYVIAVKKNQKNLYKKLESISKQEVLLSCDIEKDKSHGRNIERKVSVFEFPENERNGWKNLQRVIKVERSGNRGEKNYQETAYYISSCLKEAEVFAKIIKGHWKIENQLHWVKDVILVEDKGKISQFQAATNELFNSQNNWIKSFQKFRFYLNNRRKEVVSWSMGKSNDFIGLN